ncbi:MAG: carbohydrate ABC transporter permease [Elusimicrobiota bacterium]
MYRKKEQFFLNIKSSAWLIMLALMVIMVILPVFFMFKFSISDRSSIVTGGAVMPLWPYRISFQAYKHFLLENKNFLNVMLNSLRLASLTILFSMILGVPAAYVLARTRIHGKIFFIICLISVRFFPDICSAVPVVKIFIKFHLYGIFTGAALAHTLLALPYVIFISQGVFESIPMDLEDQAMVLGAGRVKAFMIIIIPLALPGLAAAAIYTFLLSWDEFIFVYFLLNFSNIETLTLFLKSKLTDGMRQENFLAAISMLLSLPVIFFTFIIQKYMKSGIVAGAVK